MEPVQNPGPKFMAGSFNISDWLNTISVLLDGIM